MILGPRIIVALDFTDADKARSFIDQTSADECRVKIGKESFTRAGPELVRELVARKFDVFLDLKFHDIPNTVAQACVAAAELGVWMMNVHALGGTKMMAAASAALQNAPHKPKLIAVTILTSMESSDLHAVGLSGTPQSNVLRLSNLAAEVGLDGVVCSPQEADMLRQHHGKEFILVTPGVRPASSAADDQQRIATPAQALANGADYLVIGRPITSVPDPVAALRAINAEVSQSIT